MLIDDLAAYKRDKAEFPNWEQATRVHDWRNHVPEEVRAMWKSFTAEQRLALFEWADHLASLEEWE